MVNFIRINYDEYTRKTQERLANIEFSSEKKIIIFNLGASLWIITQTSLNNLKIRSNFTDLGM